MYLTGGGVETILVIRELRIRRRGRVGGSGWGFLRRNRVGIVVYSERGVVEVVGGFGGLELNPVDFWRIW